jgi:bifunctional non-homologous end joining protein LigD
MRRAIESTLARYRAMRDFRQTAEPSGRKRRGKPRALEFVIQRHAARRLHYDFRLELDGVLKSWAVTKEPVADPAVKRLAVHVEDHPLEYANFEGTIPPKQYGAGTVAIWDRGHWVPEGDPHAGYRDGKLKFRLQGKRLEGRWALIRMRPRESEKRENWLLIKDRHDDVGPTVAPAAGDTDVAKPAAATEKASRATPRKRAAPEAKTSQLPHGPRAKLPDFIAPELATLVSHPPTTGQWRYEIKYDGYRIGARIDHGRVALVTRNGIDATARLPGIARALSALPVKTAWLDGEAVVFDDKGRSDFAALQQAIARADDGIVFAVFDVPHLDGEDLTPLAFAVRRARLAALLTKARLPLLLSLEVGGEPLQLMKQAGKLGLEGLIAKRADSTYQSRRTRDWLKLKCRPRDEFVIGGFTEPQGARTGLGSLLLGTYDGGKLRYRGRVGTGIGTRELDAMRERLLALERPDPPFASVPRYHPKRSQIHWVEPKLLAQIEYATLTSDGMVRQGSFLGLRDDKKPRNVHLPTPEPPPPDKTGGRARGPSNPPEPRAARGAKAGSDTDSVAGVRITHADREFAATEGVTKLELAQYYAAVGAHIVRELKGRPIVLMRCPGGDLGKCFVQRHAGAGMKVASWGPGGGEPVMVVDDIGAVVSCVQAGAIEFHTWGSSVPRLDMPDRFVLDLDPDAELPWARFREGCELVKTLLDRLELAWFVKTTGGKGLHFVVPLERRHRWDEVKEFTGAVARHLATTLPQLFIATASKQRRPQRIYVDYLRNAEQASAVAAFSARARPRMPVSMPIAWSELGEDIRGAYFNVRNVPGRLAALKRDPWVAYGRSAQRLTAAKRRMLRA